MAHYRDKVAVVTGGASGIGAALGRALREQGAKVVLVDINETLLGETCVALGGADAGVAAKTVDVGDAEAVAALIDDVCREHGRIDYLFNNAGIALFGEVKGMTLGQWERLIRVNLFGVVHGITAAYPRMRDQGFGHIVNTASAAGLVPAAGATAYASTKHAVVGLSTSLRPEAAGYGVRVTVVCPGLVDTPLKENLEAVSLDRERLLADLDLMLSSPERCARAMLRGVRRNRAIVTVTASARVGWWLYRLAPSLVIWAARLMMGRMRKRYLTGG